MFLKGWYSCRVSLFLILTVLFMTAIINLIIFVNDDCEHSDQYRISPRWSHELILCTILWFLESMIRQPAGFCRKRVCLPGDGRSLLSPHLLRLSPERNVFVQAPSWNSFDSNHGACKKLLSVCSSCHLDGGPRPRYIISAPHLFRIADNRDISLHQVLGRWTRHISSWLDTNLWNNWNRRCPFSHFLPAFESMKCCGDSAPSSLFSRF